MGRRHAAPYAPIGPLFGEPLSHFWSFLCLTECSIVFKPRKKSLFRHESSSSADSWAQPWRNGVWWAKILKRYEFIGKNSRKIANWWTIWGSNELLGRWGEMCGPIKGLGPLAATPFPPDYSTLLLSSKIIPKRLPTRPFFLQFHRYSSIFIEN